jgi:ParB family chromosome partitioning protein
MAAQPVAHLEKVRALAATGRLCFVGGVRADAKSEITAYDFVAEKPAYVISVPSHVLALVATDDALIAGSIDGHVRAYAVKDGHALWDVNAHAGGCTSLAVQGKVLATGGVDGALRLLGVGDGKQKKEWALSLRPLRAVAIDPAGESFAAGGDDGVVRVVGDGRDRRDMSGHDGPVLALAFTPADGRLVSGGEDGTVRIWYLVGEVESDLRGKDDTLHTGGATAVLFPPAKDAAEIGERLVSVGADGKLRVWRMSERRKPRSFDTGSDALFALAFLPWAKSGTLGSLVTAGDGRTLHVVVLDGAGAPTDRTFKWSHGFDVHAAALAAPARATRETSIKALSPLGEPEALALLERALAKDPDPELRALAATELAAHGRRDARKTIRERLDDENAGVRQAALAALVRLEAETPLSPLRAALDSRFPDTRIAALRALSPLFATSPLVSGLIAARLSDADGSVRRAALKELVSLDASRTVEALRTAFERGQADIRAEVLVRVLASAANENEKEKDELHPLVVRALDDEDETVRRIAFVSMTLYRPALAAWLEAKDEAFARAVKDVVDRVLELSGVATVAGDVDTDVSRVIDVSKQFARFTHPKHGEIAIFKPEIHTPLNPGDEVRLIGVRPADRRATGYAPAAKATSSSAAVAEARARLIPPGSSSPGEEDREPLLAALACRAPDTALRGARGLALFGDMRALGALLTISREPAPELRREAAYALVSLKDSRAKRRLLWMMNDGDASVRSSALGYYAVLEPNALAVAEAALQSSQEDVRVRGLDILVKQGRGPEADALLTDSIEDESPKVRTEAFRTLWAWHEKEPLAPLDRTLTARFPDLRVRAVTELATLAKDPKGAHTKVAMERLRGLIGDRDHGVAKAAYDSVLEIAGKEDLPAHLAGLASLHPALRVQAAKDARKESFDQIRSSLAKLLEDADASVRVAAIEALDRTSPEAGPVAVGLQSSHLDLRVRSAELLARRHEESIIDPMQALLADKDLLLRLPLPIIQDLRRRAATALATLGSPRLLKYFATILIKDDDGVVREQASRGVANASRRGEEGHLLDLLGHADLAVRSWAAEGLARLGDARALPVLVGTLKHEHPPIRVGAVLSFAALGPEGYSGILQGLEDPSREVQTIVLAVILARDLRAFRQAEPPELLTSALSSQRPEVRFAAARAIELRIDPEAYMAHLVELLLPERPEKAADMAQWPSEELRARMMVGLAGALAGDRPEQRYAATQALRLRGHPLEYFREVDRAVAPRSVRTPWVPETTPRVDARPEPGKKGPLGILRRLFASGAEADEKAPEPAPSPVPADEQARLRQLAFGAYVGLLRQGTADDEAHRVRRDAIDRIVELTKEKYVTIASASPALSRALDDPNHLVRQAAFAALRKVYDDPETPLSLALASSTADVVRAALDELAARGPEAKGRIARALDSNVREARKYAFELLEKLSPPSSLEPLLAALSSEHPDIRIGVLERLATSLDSRVSLALAKALESDHDDLRLRAAELLATRKDDRAADALGPWLRSDDAAIAARARGALAQLGSRAAVQALSARFDDGVAEPERLLLTQAVADTRAGEAAISALVARFVDESPALRRAAFDGGVAALGPRSDKKPGRGMPPRAPRDPKLSALLLEGAARARHADVREAATTELDDAEGAWADALLVPLLVDRDPRVRTAAATSYSRRVEKKGADPAPLEAVLRGGARDTMLAAAEGLASKGVVAALRPLLLFARAGEEGERERAVLGLGTLGDKRALVELETLATGGTEEAPAELPMQAAAVEALGRLLAKLDPDDRERVRDRVESNVGTKESALAVAALRGLRWIGGERSRARLEGALLEKTSTNAEKTTAASLLGELGDTVAEAALAKALGDEDDDVRWSAREALDKLFPNDRTRVEFLAVTSEHDDISEPAAAFLADRGDASRLLSKLGEITRDSLRERIRFGLVRREALPAADLVALLGGADARARADAAWVVGARGDVDAAWKKQLGPALLNAAHQAEKAHAEAVHAGKDEERGRQESAWVRSVWALRELDAPSLSADAKRWLSAERDTPRAIRLQAAWALAGGGKAEAAALHQALTDEDPDVRSAAARALRPVADVSTLAGSPKDPVRAGLAAGPGPGASLGSSFARDALLPRVIREHDTAAIAGLAKGGEAQGEAIAALGAMGTADAISALSLLAAKGGSPDEAVRKAAFRALRRASRIKAAREKHKEASS